MGKYGKSNAAHDYYLQAAIYAEAFARLLQATKMPGVFGGMYYIFLRGLTEGSSAQGIFHFMPDGALLDQRNLAQRLACTV